MSAQSPHSDASTLSVAPGPAAAEQAEQRHLLVFNSDSCRLVPLPQRGEFHIGRAPDVDLNLSARAASRRHATLLIDDEGVQLIDQGSHNGTLVNGDRIHAPRELCSGDVISVGDVRLVFHRSGRSPRPGPVLDRALLRLRLEQEISRLTDAQRRALVLVCVEFPAAAPERARAQELLRLRLRPADALAWDEDTLFLLLPDLPDVDLDEIADEILGQLGPLSVPMRAGFASCPNDGGDVDTLLASARSAARQAPPGAVLAASQTAVTLQVGTRQVLAAEPAMLQIYETLRRLAQSDLPVLVLGETGTGKDLASAALHCWSRRAEARCVALNCAALPESLLESELFGHRRGTFTSAIEDKPGIFENASGGTVFLDEVAELSPGAQSKLLRVLETRLVTRLGESRERAVDFRIVAATHRDLMTEVNERRFRQDLFFRLRGATVLLPPLRERRRELPILARHFLQAECARAGRAPMIISGEAMQRLQAYAWPGNVRELRLLMESIAVMESASVLQPWHLQHRLLAASAPGISAAGPPAAPGEPEFRPLAEEIEELERTRIGQAMRAAGQVQARAAELLRMPPRTLYTKLRQFGLLPRRRQRTEGRGEGA